MQRTFIALIVILFISVIAGTVWFVMQTSPANNTTKLTNNTDYFTATNNTTVNNTTSKEVTDTNENNNPPPPSISPEKAKELAKKYVGPGVILGKPVLTTYKKIRAWQVPVYTMDHKFINNIYIDEKTGRKVD